MGLAVGDQRLPGREARTAYPAGLQGEKLLVVGLVGQNHYTVDLDEGQVNNYNFSEFYERVGAGRDASHHPHGRFWRE
jgi:hypothetical protein